MYTYFDEKTFLHEYKLWDLLNNNSFAFSNEDRLALVRHKGKNYLAVEKFYFNFPSDGKKMKYFLNDASFYEMAFPRNDIVLGVHCMNAEEGMKDADGNIIKNISLISLLIPTTTPRKETLKTIKHFRTLKTPA